MRRMLMKGILLSAIACQCAYAQTSDSEEAISSDDAQKIAMALATCAGVWDALSEATGPDEAPATSEQFRNMGNGAETAAMWILASHLALTEKKATKYGSWSDLTRPKRDSGKTMILALAENNADQDISGHVVLCQAMLTEQENILQMMRMERVRKTQAE